ncbi:MAG: lasso peptide biosynthesis B2 protein [Deltaproteobacteria bacterium]|nr:lasso peptide biosynthesis B2 protein [Deltaproteobacteria bacterium]
MSPRRAARHARALVRWVGAIHGLDAESKRALAEAGALLPGIHMSLRTRGLDRTRADLRRLVATRPRQEGTIDAHRVGLLLNELTFLGFGAFRCLARSLALWTVLRRRGLEAEIQLGVPKAQGSTFVAHAWVTVGGRAIGERGDVEARHRVFDRPLP